MSSARCFQTRCTGGRCVQSCPSRTFIGLFSCRSEAVSVKVGQLYASTHGSDVERDQSQRLRVWYFVGDYAVLRFEDPGVRGFDRVRVRDGRLPGYRLIEEAGA